MSCDRVRWVSAVGDNAVQGGGVARGVSLFKASGIINSCDSDFLDLSSIGRNKQFVFAIRDVIFYRYRCFIVHSFFSPYVVMLMLLPVRINLVLLPHGELKEGALKISERKKKVIIKIISKCSFLNSKLKRISVLASNEEELFFAKKVLGEIVGYRVDDIIGPNMMLADNSAYVPGEGVNIINVARMVPNKGVGDFLDALFEQLQKKNGRSWFDNVKSIHLFFVPECHKELERVKQLANLLQQVSGPKVYLYESLDHSQISKILKTLPNRLPFITSQFESFSYALVELSGLEFKPIVWFKNELVDEMCSADICVHLEYGSLETFDGKTPVLRADPSASKEYFYAMKKNVELEYRAILKKELGNDFRKFM
ncbi:Glycosyltransferase involved in cell wall bisynthesis [Amphritea atlantica]|uniref:Glycosyltransferase involved in cell wall bisynthesis n=1 Tax=Amphritea atlantica TaxID=355243 RepID=A0A1H9L602_9GAMM|nr:hypothetical protein [Amphritea atlantica]SER06790.1 Glycosyltransferase involved in cell wall bisynthesis [Amphritea atlantica]